MKWKLAKIDDIRILFNLKIFAFFWGFKKQITRKSRIVSQETNVLHLKIYNIPYNGIIIKYIFKLLFKLNVLILC